MSILIKGMEMPTSCTECPCCRHDNWNGETAHQCNVSFITFGAEDENWIYNTRPNWCPLIELPPHGRLIDATFEENHYASMLLNPTPDVTEQDKHKARIVIDALRMAKTAIKAEERRNERKAEQSQ